MWTAALQSTILWAKRFGGKKKHSSECLATKQMIKYTPCQLKQTAFDLICKENAHTMDFKSKLLEASVQI